MDDEKLFDDLPDNIKHKLKKALKVYDINYQYIRKAFDTDNILINDCVPLEKISQVFDLQNNIKYLEMVNEAERKNINLQKPDKNFGDYEKYVVKFYLDPYERHYGVNDITYNTLYLLEKLIKFKYNKKQKNIMNIDL